MRALRRALPLLCAAALTVTACSSGSGGGGAKPPPSGFNAAMAAVVDPSAVTGGTLRLGANYDCDSWDPAAVYIGACWNMQRLMTRTLMAIPRHGDPASAPAAGAVVPDLATAPGVFNADKTQWTYTIRPGLKFSTGDPLTSADIKYGIERMWATDVLSGGPAQYYLCLLDTCNAEGETTYKGPYADPSGGLASITTPDATTITFHLTRPYGDFDHLMALPASAPVPKAADTKAQYTNTVVSSGPFVRESYTPKQSAVWVRNPNWTQDSDPIRRPLVDRVTLTILSNPDDVDARLKNGSLDLSATSGAQPTFQSDIVNTPALKARADNPVTGFVGMFAIFPTAAPLDKVECRRAVAYALDKRDLLVQSGGTYGGEFAKTLLPPAVPGFDPGADRYPSGPDMTGDLVKAKEQLALCGHPDGFSTVMAYTNADQDPQVFASVQAALKRVGITVTGQQQDVSVFYGSFIGSPTVVANQKLGIALLGWAPDFANGAAYLNLLIDGSRIQENGNTNFVSVNDPVLNDLIGQAAKAAPDAQGTIFKELDRQTMERALYIPFVQFKQMIYRNPRLTNVDLRGEAGAYDLVNLGVSDGK